MSERILITGGSGFVGRRLAKRLARDNDVVLGSRNNKQNLTAANETGCEVLPLDVSSVQSVRDALREVRPQIVIHGAATKFVDLAERHPLDCIDVNVLGSANVARAAMDAGVQTVLGISTDKASPPVRNTYGLSKALMERLFCSLHGRTTTQFACVRCGNVAWSTGSVLPEWKRMHSATGVIGTTGPHMRRFFLTVDEAVQLVCTALAQIDEIGGRVLARSMRAAQIGDLLETFTAAYGGQWQRIEGRPGESDDEFLIGDTELPFTREVHFEGVSHYIISFCEPASDHLTESVSSASAARFTEQEMLDLIALDEG